MGSICTMDGEERGVLFFSGNINFNWELISVMSVAQHFFLLKITFIVINLMIEQSDNPINLPELCETKRQMKTKGGRKGPGNEAHYVSLYLLC